MRKKEKSTYRKDDQTELARTIWSGGGVFENSGNSYRRKSHETGRTLQ